MQRQLWFATCEEVDPEGVGTGEYKAPGKPKLVAQLWLGPMARIHR